MRGTTTNERRGKEVRLEARRPRRPAPASTALPLLLTASFGAASLGLSSTSVHGQLGDLATVASAGTNDNAGWGLAAADFDGDGYEDLAVGAPGDATVATNGGFVLWIPGGPCGLESSSNFILQESFGETTEAGDRFGAALAAGFFDDDPYADLAVGIPGKRIGGEDNAGAVAVLYGSATGLDATTGTLFHQSQLAGVAEAGDQLGFSLTVADFDGDGYDDLAAGAVGDTDLGGGTETGQVHVLVSNDQHGLTTTGDRVYWEAMVDPLGVANFDRFGETLTTGDFDGDGVDDLVIGAPLDNPDGSTNAGEVTVLPGTFPNGPTTTGSRVFVLTDVDPADPGAEFGFALASGRFEGDPGDDLAIGAPLYAGGNPARGRVYVAPSLFPFADGFENGDFCGWSQVVP